MQENEEKFKQIEQKTSDIVGISAVVVQDFYAKRKKDYEFDINDMTQYEGATGPCLQYAFARCSSIIRKATSAGVELIDNPKTELLVEPEAANLCLVLGRFPKLLADALNSHEAQVLTHYAFELAAVIAYAHKALRVIGREKDLAEARLCLFYVAKITMETTIKIIGLTPVDRM